MITTPYHIEGINFWGGEMHNDPAYKNPKTGESLLIWGADNRTSNVSSPELIDSAATSREEIGNPPHYGTKNKLYEENIPLVPHRARQMTRDDYLYFDYLIGMDSANIRNMTRIAGGTDSQDKIYKMLSFAGYEDTQKFTGARDVADPWYTGNFDETYEDVVAGCKGFLYYLQQKGDISKEIEIPR